MKKFLLTCFALGIALSSFAQERTVTGKVTSTEDGSPLPGVNVILKGTTSGTSTDGDGNYSVAVPSSGGALIFSFIGLESKEVEIGERTVVNVSLALDITQLSEVVVVGYGTQSKRDVSGSIASISGKEIATAPVQSFDQALQGRAAGVNITTPNGVLNNPPVIRIRGVNSITLSSFPLVVIDGVPTYSGDNSTNSAAYNPLANVNPADIESIEVLKDASATAIYGSRASAGVILITTKRGTNKGKARVSIDSWVAESKPFRLFDLLNAEQYMEIKNEAMTNNNLTPGFNPSYDANGNLIDTDWYKEVYRTGFSHSNSINFSGGSDATTYYLSVGHTGQEGMLKQNSFGRSNVRLNLDHKVSKKLSTGVNMAFSNSVSKAPNSGSLPGQAFNTGGLGRLPLITAPNVAPLNADGSYNISGANIGLMANTQQSGFYNPRLILDKDRFTSTGNEIQGSLYLNLEIIKGLNLRSTYGIDRLQIEDNSYQNPLNGDGFTSVGVATNTYRTNNRWNWQNVAQYDFKVGEKNSFSALVGGEQQYTEVSRWGAQRTTAADPFFTSYQGNFTNITAANNAQTENYLLSYFGRVNYDFAKKYFVTFNFRRDGYSAFASGRKYGNFWGTSLGYTISEEEFWKNSSLANTINFIKLKASYGEVGNNQGIGDFVSLQSYNSSLYGTEPTIAFSQAGNGNISWETSKKTDIGINLGFLQDRIQVEAVYYKNNVDGLILDVPQAPSKGIPGNVISANIGSMENSGLEFSVKTTAIHSTNFTWEINANITTLKNNVTSLAYEGQIIRTATSGLETSNLTKVGESIGVLNVVETIGVNPENGRRMFKKADGTIVQYDHSNPTPGNRWTVVETGAVTTAPNTTADGKIYGPTLPTWYGGFDNTFKYKNFDLGVFVQFSGGNYLYNGTQAGLRDMRFWNNHTDVLNRWTPENPNGTIPRVVYTDNVSNGSSFPISENVEKGDFARLRNVSLGYTIPGSILEKVKISSARVYVQVQNAALLTKYTGIDPEISTNGNTNLAPGVDRNSVGQQRTFSFGINLGL
jgi:TonB-dependent starch-binding outer membrane protein SusC